MSIAAPMCVYCIHRQKRTRRCAAFPGQIPAEIYFEGADHREPWPDDGGVQFEPIPGMEEEARQHIKGTVTPGSKGFAPQPQGKVAVD